MRDAGLNVVTFDEWIHKAEFNNRLKCADAIISPLRQIPKSRSGYKELHGRTTGTGTVFDAMGFGKPLLLPQEYAIGEEINDIARHYEDREDLNRILNRLITERDFLLKWKRESFKNAQRFCLEKQRRRFEQILQNCIR
jgi:hypothetical protein